MATETTSMDDGTAIRDLIATWIQASKSGDTETVLRLIHDDALFMTPGVKPFGKAAFAQSSEQMKNMNFEADSEILEVEILGHIAWCRTRLAVKMTSPNRSTVRRSGYTLTIFRKSATGQWQLFRDANLLTLET